MLREYLTEKYVLGALGFLILLSIACVLWYRYDTAPHKQQIADAKKQQSERAATPQAKTNNMQTQHSTDQNLTETEAATEKLTTETENPQTTTDTELKDFTNVPTEIQETDTSEIRESPFGLGPYPEVPKDYDYPREFTAQFQTIDEELMARVRLKLWKQGIRDIKGMAYMDGRIYINRPGTVYIGIEEQVEDNGDYDRSTVFIGNAVSDAELKQITEGKSIPGLQVLDITEGIKPYTFLNLKN